MSSYYTSSDIDEVDRLVHLANRKKLQYDLEDSYPRFKGMTTIEIGVLRVLAFNPEATPTEIAREIGISKSTLTSAINRLEKRGYIARTISPVDRRSFRLALTGEGAAAQNEHLAFEKAFYTRMLGLLESKEEVATFLALAAKVISGF